MVSVILPTYNEAENLAVIIPQIIDVLHNSKLAGEIIVVDDDSPDDTAGVAGRLAQNYPVRVFIRKNERGLATAVMKGFEMAAGDICIVMDADLSHPVAQIPEMVKPILAGTCDATVGSRYTSGGGYEDWPLARRFISKFSGLLARGLTQLSDPTSGFMAIRKPVLNNVILNPVGWKIVLETIVKTGVRFREVPIVFADRQKGKSKLGARVQAQYIAHLMMLYQFKYPGIHQFLKYCTVGFMGVLVDTVILIALVELIHFDPRLAAIFAFLSAISSNYLWNRYWTFETGRSFSLAGSYVRFIAVCLLGLLVRICVMHVLIEHACMGVGYRYVMASLIGIFIATVFNFFGTKLVVFSNKGTH